MNLETISGPRLLTAYEKADSACREMTSRMIEAGLGRYTYADSERAAAAGDDLCAEYIRRFELRLAIRREMDARRAYHGGTKPIKRPAVA